MSTEFSAPQSRIEAILQNILGADNVIKPPFSRNEVLLIAIMEELAGGGSGTDANAVHYTADTGKTSSEKEQARTNINADNKKFRIVVDTTANPITADKTWLELSSATVDGALCVVEDDVYTYYLVDFDDVLSIAYFSCPKFDLTGKLMLRTLRVNSSNEWTLYTSSYDFSPHRVVDLESTTITISEPVDNTVYEYSTLSSLTISNQISPHSYVIKFDSGSTATTTSFPATIKGLESFAAESNTHYEINVDGYYAVVGKWALS